MLFLEVAGQPVRVDTGGRTCDPALPTAVFIHGAQHDGFVWAQLLRALAGAGRNVIAPDLPGHGQSGGAPLPSIESMADWLLALLDKAGVGETAEIRLVGHSMGSLVALEAAARAPQRIRRLVMIGSAVPMPVAPMLLAAARDDAARAMALINRWSHSPRAWRGACGGAGLWLPALNLRIMERQPPGTLYTDLAACDTYLGGMAAVARLRCPVTLIAGQADRMTPVKTARNLAAALPRSRLTELPGVGHALMAEAPAAVRAAIGHAISSSA